MAETQVTIPIGLNEGPAHPAQQTPQPTAQERPVSGFQDGQYIPPSQRTTLHRTRLGVALYGQSGQAKAATPAPVPQQSAPVNDAVSQQINQLTNAVTLLAANQLGNMQRGYDAPDRGAEHLEKLRLHSQYGDGGPYVEDGASQPQWGGPDASRFDFFDEQDTADFHRLANEHVERTVQQRLEAERSSQWLAAQLGDLNRQHEALRVKFGKDANFEEVLPAAGALITESGFKLTAEEAYLRASADIEARSGARRSTYLPADCKTLGQIMRYNLETGRSKPR